MKKTSQLKVIISNCLNGGTGWNNITSRLTYNLTQQMKDVDTLEFKEVNSNAVRGEHNSFTIILTGVIYNWSIQQSKDETSKLLEYVRNAANRVEELVYSEIRIEHLRTFSLI